MSLLLENFCLNIFYDNVLLHFGSEWVKIHNVKKKKNFFYTQFQQNAVRWGRFIRYENILKEKTDICIFILI